jgi:catechol 2,3-dioxygenase-like lactoylglutathione lyase family enzyme
MAMIRQPRYGAARVGDRPGETEAPMIAEYNATVMIPASDLERAKAWYRDKLGLVPSREEPFGASYVLGGGTRAFLYKSDYAGTAQHTLITFATPDARRDMAELRAKGVEFLDYDLPGLKTVDGIAEFGAVKNCWARDSEGNILGFVEGM